MKSNKVIHHTGRDGNVYSDVETEIENLRLRAPWMTTGVKCLFVQTAAPTGWTKDTTHDDRALRVVSGAASSGGSVAFSTVFGITATGSTTLTTSHMPTGVQFNMGTAAVRNDALNVTTATPGTSGGGTGHTHSIDLRVNYVDVIICTKD